MHEGWKYAELGAHIDLLTGYPFKSSEYSTDGRGIRLLRGDNVIQGSIRWADACHWPEDRMEGLAQYQLEVGDLVVALDRTWVKAGLKAATIRHSDLPCLLVQRVARLRGTQALDQYFLAVIVQSHRFIEMVKSSKTETAVPHISPNDIRDFVVALPSLPEQRTIARIMQAWDTAIQKTDQLIAAKERHYSHELSRLISRGQHPHTHVGSFAEEVSARNRGGKWQTVALSEICTVWKGQQLNKDAMVEDGTYYALNGGTKPSGRTTEWNCEADTITISEGGNSCGFVSYNRDRFWCGGHCYALKNLANDVDAHYLFHYLKGKQARVMALRVGSGLPNIQKSDIEAFPVVLPGLATQTAIARYLNVLREELNLLGQSVSALKTQKRGLMQKLLTGQWRLPVQEEAS